MPRDHKPIANPSLEWDIIDLNIKAKEYTIKNKVTGEQRTVSAMSKERMLEFMAEQAPVKH
jgi:hypothetical protein